MSDASSSRQSLPAVPPDILNLAEGLERCMNDEGLYKSLLAEFRKEFSDAGARLEEMVRQSAWKEAEALAHSLKGTAGMMSASGVFAAASALDAHLKTARDTGAPTPGLQARLEQVTAELARLAHYLSPRSEGPSTACTADITPVKRAIADSAATIASLADQADGIAAAAAGCVAALKAGGKILTAGNGGSAAEALHMAEEFTGRYRGNRPSLPAIALVADCTALTCIANDYGYDYVFSRQVEGLGREGDVLVLFSTSGNAANLEKSLEAARARGLKVLCLLGKSGGRLKGKGDWEILVRSERTERIQEAHQLILHLILEAAEQAFPA